MFTAETIEHIYKNQPDVRDIDKRYLDDYTNGKLILIRGCHLDWLTVAAHHKHQRFIDAFMQANNVPDGLTFKEQLCYLQLLGDVSNGT